MEPNTQNNNIDYQEFFGGEMKPFVQHFPIDENEEEITGVTANTLSTAEKMVKPSFWRRFIGLFTF